MISRSVNSSSHYLLYVSYNITAWIICVHVHWLRKQKTSYLCSNKVRTISRSGCTMCRMHGGLFLEHFALTFQGRFYNLVHSNQTSY